MIPEVKLTLGTILSAPSELRVTYELVNGSSHTIYPFLKCRDLWSVLSDPPRPTPTDELAQMCYGDNHVLFFRLGRIPQNVPPGMSAYAPRLPYAVRIAPGTSYRAVLRAPLPLAEWSLYDPPNREGPQVKAVEIQTVRVQVEYILDKDSAHVTELGDSPATFQLLGNTSHHVEVEGDVSNYQLLLLTHPVVERFHQIPEGAAYS